METQVLIVGAGPVGLTMAIELVRYGVAVRIVDKAAARTDKSKALVLWSRTLELLDRAGCTQTFIDAGHKVIAANIIAGTKRIGHVSIETVDSPYPFALMLPQSETERLLEEHLGQLGVQVERQVEAVSFEASTQNVSTTLRFPDGHEETHQCQSLIGCDGAHSMVRHGLNATFLGNTLQSNWVLGDVHLAGFPFPDTEIATYWHQDGVLVFFPITPGRYRVIANVHLPEGIQPCEPTLAELQAVMDRRGPGNIVASDPIWLSAFKINERKVGDYRAGRVFLAGDAAHVHSPAGGQGMNTGMQDAFNLAWKLAMVFHKMCSPEILKSYSVERSAVGEQVLRNAGRLTALGVLQNPALQTVRNLLGRVVFGLSPVQRAMVNVMTEVSIGYEHSPLNGPDIGRRSGPAPGDRIAPIAGQKPVGGGDRPRFALFADINSAVISIIEKFPTLIDANIRPPLAEGGIWLARPDGYVACVAKHSDTQTIADYLQHYVVIAAAARPQAT